MSKTLPTAQRTATVALIGNPNTGKSTLFGALCGVRQRVGNYPGVTVEKRLGKLRVGDEQMQVVDLPGTYSLAPRSPDEMIAVDVLLGRQEDVGPSDVVLCILDASNLQRNLYLVSQVLELGRPTVIALNMVDLAEAKGYQIDVPQLEQRLQVPVIPIQANRKVGLERLKRALQEAAGRPRHNLLSPFPEVFQREVAELEAYLAGQGESLPRYLVERLLLDTTGYLQQAQLPGVSDELLKRVEAARARLAAAGHPVPGVEAVARYGWIGQLLKGVVEHTPSGRVTLSDRLDRVLTHRLWGTLIFVLLMLVVFQAVFSWAEYPMTLIEGSIASLGDWLGSLLPDGTLRSLVVDGAVAGVGGVLVFLPQIFILFLFIAVLEDCGYMARAAYLMDKVMVRVGLSGKSFIPLLSSFACAIPGIMAARVIENRRDRLVTVLVAPLMSCSARLPVYMLLIAAFIPDKEYLRGWLGLQGITMFSMYMVGMLAAILVAWVLKKTILRSPTPPFVMELPSYKFPSLLVVLHRMFEQGWAFVQRAGTLIFAISVLVWAAAYFPHNDERAEAPYRPQLEQIDARAEQLQSQLASAASPETQADLQAELSELAAQREAVEFQIQGEYIRHSALGYLGRAVEPVVRPLGWDWRLGCAALASFPAREVVIATLGVIYNLGDEQDENSEPLRTTLQQATWDGTNRPVFTVPVALSVMVFFALCAQCASTLVVMRRETNSWRWPLFTFTYMTTLAYLGALVTYQVGTWLANLG